MQTRRRRQQPAAAASAAQQQQQQAPILRLPDSLLSLVLGQLSLGLRLGTCSLVCSSWREAAVEATTAIRAVRQKWQGAHLDALTTWLRKHASTALRELVLDELLLWCDLSYAQVCSFALPVRQLRGLRVLTLPPCVLPAGSLRELSALTALTELTLPDVRSASGLVVTRSKARAQKQPTPLNRDTASLAAAAADLTHMLKHLPALSRLRLGGVSASALLPALTADNSALRQQLASLGVVDEACITPELVAALPTSLTQLVLAAVGPDLEQYEDGVDITDRVRVSKHTMPRLGQLTRLQELQLHGLGLDCSADGGLAGLFESMTQLTSLGIDGFEAVLGEHTQADGSDELAEFLTAIGHLASLRSLMIVGAFRCLNWGDMEPSSAPLCAGLLASTSLTRLFLNNVLLPQGCGLHMFGRPGLRLPHLAELNLQGFALQGDDGIYKFTDPYLTGSDVQSIVACCAGGCLCQLGLVGVVKGPADYSVLSALTALTSLSLGASRADGVHELVRLRELRLSDMLLQSSTMVAVAQRLTQLTQLCILESKLFKESGAVPFEFVAQDDDEGGDGRRQRRARPVCKRLAAALKLQERLAYWGQ